MPIRQQPALYVYTHYQSPDAKFFKFNDCTLDLLAHLRDKLKIAFLDNDKATWALLHQEYFSILKEATLKYPIVNSLVAHFEVLFKELVVYNDRPSTGKAHVRFFRNLYNLITRSDNASFIGGSRIISLCIQHFDYLMDKELYFKCKAFMLNNQSSTLNRDIDNPQGHTNIGSLTNYEYHKYRTWLEVFIAINLDKSLLPNFIDVMIAKVTPTVHYLVLDRLVKYITVQYDLTLKAKSP